MWAIQRCFNFWSPLLPVSADWALLPFSAVPQVFTEVESLSLAVPFFT